MAKSDNLEQLKHTLAKMAQRAEGPAAGQGARP